MKWRKLGLVLKPDQAIWWSHYYSMMPTPVFLPEFGVIRIFYGTTDREKFGRTNFVDVSVDDPTKIILKNSQFVLDKGLPGTFDDSGAVPSSIISVNSQYLLYYVGFQRTQLVPYMLMTGLAISDNLVTFKRYSNAPIIDRSKHNVFSNAAPFVLFDERKNCYRMWLWVGESWVTVKEKVYLHASIYHATSTDALSWQLDRQPCLVADNLTEFSVGRPWVLIDNDSYKMFYSVRHKEKLYRLGYAESPDGINWDRKDNVIGIDVSGSGWDSEMVCYPAVITIGSRTYLFYNGNDNGETGFGVAVLEKD
jgi:hypothetical protein